MIQKLISIVIIIVVAKLGWFLIEAVRSDRQGSVVLVERLPNNAELEVKRLIDRLSDNVYVTGKRLAAKVNPANVDTGTGDPVIEAQERLKKILEGKEVN